MEKAKELHLTLQGKGGVGKTLITTMVAQYLFNKGVDNLCIDADPVNKTFSGFKSLNVKTVDIMNGDMINIRSFDNIIEMVLNNDVVIIDNGASSFIPLTAYLKEGEIINFLSEKKITVYIHCSITGGQALVDTIKGLDYIINSFGEDAKTIVWLNEYFGKIIFKEKTFEDMQVFKKNKSKIYGIITIPEMSKDTFGIDVKQMLEDRVTFDEYISSDQYMVIPKQRIKKFKDIVFNNISIVL